jgi:lipoate-protein ligase B
MESVTGYNLRECQSYTKIFQLQQTLSALRADNLFGNSILLLEHSPVMTIGRTPGADAHLLVDPDTLQRRRIEVCRTNRGGDMTYHGPGQLVVYYILLLVERDIHRFIRQIEHSVLTLLARYGIQGHRKPEYPGVWVGEEKICALGFSIRKWVTMHGIALNVAPDLSQFTLIVPCGIRDKGVTSLQKIYQQRQIASQVTMEQIKRDYLTSFAETFGVDMVEGEPQSLWQYLDTSL